MMIDKIFAADKSSSKKVKDFRQGATSQELPPIPIYNVGVIQEPIVDTRNSYASTEIALLLDHLSLAKEENREILKLTNAAMSQIKSVNEMVISSKDELIHLLSEKIERLNQYKTNLEIELKKSHAQSEDLEILINTVLNK